MYLKPYWMAFRFLLSYVNFRIDECNIIYTNIALFILITK